MTFNDIEKALDGGQEIWYSLPNLMENHSWYGTIQVILI